MTIQSYDKFIRPLIEILAQYPQGIRTADAYDLVADQADVPADARSLILPSGQQEVYKNRIAWAYDRLKRAKLGVADKRGTWQLTPDGLALASRLNNVSDDEIAGIATANRDGLPSNGATRRRRQTATRPGEQAPAAPPPENALTPDERISAAVEDLNDAVASDLLAKVTQMKPAAFEGLVLDVLHALGYGATNEDLRQVGGSGDGGIDGVISLDKLGLEKVYVQAKRWQANVGSPEIQKFMGALQLQDATKGVFITTSDYTADAREAAAKAHGKLVLIDGGKLMGYMIAYGVGVSHRVIKIPRIDHDYFEEG